MTTFAELSRIQLLMTQAISAAAQTMEGVAETWSDARVALVQPICGGAGWDGTSSSIMNVFNPSYWPLSGHKPSHQLLALFNEDLMLMDGEIRAWGIFLQVAPGAGNSRSFQLVKNEVAVGSPLLAFVGTNMGFKTATTGLPISFVAGDRFGIKQSWAGTPADANASWTVHLRMMAPP